LQANCPTIERIDDLLLGHDPLPRFGRNLSVPYRLDGCICRCRFPDERVGSDQPGRCEVSQKDLRVLQTCSVNELDGLGRKNWSMC